MKPLRTLWAGLGFSICLALGGSAQANVATTGAFTRAATCHATQADRHQQ